MYRYEIITVKYLQIQSHCPSLNHLFCADARLEPQASGIECKHVTN